MMGELAQSTFRLVRIRLPRTLQSGVDLHLAIVQRLVVRIGDWLSVFEDEGVLAVVGPKPSDLRVRSQDEILHVLGTRGVGPD
mgnify:CR=1 FL=1